jgi:formylglycine-generating enzyme required for sulfatase activity
MLDIFLSYKSEDRTLVEPLVRLLVAERFIVWWDATLVPGERFAQAIHRALEEAPCVVVAWSRNSVESHWVHDEACFARDRQKIVPVSIDGVEPPLGFRQLQTVNLTGWAGHADDPRIHQLIAGVRRLVSKPADTVGKVVIPPEQNREAVNDPDLKGNAKTSGSRWGTRIKVLAGALVTIACAAIAAATFLHIPRTPHKEPLPRPMAAERSFNDCAVGCPIMIIVPTGSFLMGSPDGESQRGNDEGPQHEVAISKVIAVGKYPVTFEEWDFCHSHGGCSEVFPSDNNWGRGTHPVLNVSWQDAQDYVAWLSKFTGRKYRLLSEAEREYITRAGTLTPFWWGTDVSTTDANYDGTKKYLDEPTGLFRQETLSVNTFDPNPWGFFQVSGNTWDWVEDCYHDSYDGAPKDGSAWTTGDCSRHVLRGGSWGSQPRNIRSAARWRLPTETREPYYGFRVAMVCDSRCNF